MDSKCKPPTSCMASSSDVKQTHSHFELSTHCRFVPVNVNEKNEILGGGESDMQSTVRLCLLTPAFEEVRML